MSEWGPEPSEDALDAEREEWVESHDTRQRVKDVMIGIREPVPASEVAERAQCSPNAARKHLEEFVDLGVVQARTDGGTRRYVRNDEYFRWRRANRLACTKSAEWLLDELKELEERDEAFREKFETSTPADVRLPDDADHADIHDRLEASREWATIREEMNVYRDAIRMARRSGDELTA